MPARNTIKSYIENGYYHIYNRGVEKRTIFLDKQDYGVFLGYLKEYLLPKNITNLQEQLTDPTLRWGEKEKILKALRLNNFADEIRLIAYCLMPNHFHFFVKQKSATAIHGFIQSLCTRYTMYFNKKYKRVGSLFQGVYKAASVTDEEQYLHLSRYIHRQALNLQGETFEKYPCSYYDYLGKQNTDWVHPDEMLTYFSKTNPQLSYETFVLQNDSGNEVFIPTLEVD